ncbi:MAG: hypothetical protein A2174_01835 [Candidatus Portnoybacteria bacterium RBG_13_41_18]|uniref:Uncharacterized protein n=1 Tax=Candidatus Portnoybacteria bacterium RBG_13_41_18 TaxID=1801991 RepID=A0A1G2F4Q9_9BACT|nr:MAG: hypothetical protein A2174_01835 [Candidatus Portnoybacteria bacterium RBG_13_41_18]
MKLFTFREVAEPGMRSFRKTRIMPSLFAVHPTKEQISQEEWSAIKKEAEARLETARAEFKKINDKVLKEVDKKKMRFSDSKTDEYIYRRYRELGAPTCNMAMILGEILKKKGFEILGFQELTFCTPLDPIEKQVADEMPPIATPFDRLNISSAISTLESYIDTGDIIVALSKR